MRGWRKPQSLAAPDEEDDFDGQSAFTVEDLRLGKEEEDQR